MTLDQLHDHLTRSSASAVAAHPLVLKFRLHPFDPFMQVWESDNVVNTLPLDRMHDAAFEIAFETPFQLAQFQASEAYAAATGEQARFVKQISVFPQREAYSMIQAGDATLLGRRGASIAHTIVEAGAITNYNYNHDIVELSSGGALATA